MLFNQVITYSHSRPHTNSPRSVQDCEKPLEGFLHSIQIFWNRKHGHSGLKISLSIKMALSQRIKQVRENPYLSEFVETPQNRYPRVAFAVGINFASCLAGNRRSDCQEIKKEVRHSLSNNLLFLLLFPFSLSFPPSHRVGRTWVKRTCPLMPHVKPSLVGLDFLIHLSLYFGIFIQWHHVMCPPMAYT